jgi:hypothetical protein
VENGYKLHDGYYFRRFPVWFSFRGNHAPVLSSGKAAAICGKVRNEYDIAEIAQRQMEWIIGRNSFAQSTMYGEGYDFSQMYIQLPGEQVGEMVVGIESWENDDVPFWPQVNTATYKEVWTHAGLRWLWIAADCYGPADVTVYVQYAPGEKLMFKNTLSGAEYVFEPEYRTGKVSCKLPAGRYGISYRGAEISKTLVAAKEYEISSFIGFVPRYEINGDTVRLAVEIQGTGEASLCPRSANITLDESKKTGKAGETVIFTGKIKDASKPWVVLFVPDGNISEAFEVYNPPHPA